MFTKGYELTTGLTNILIFLVSMLVLIILKNKLSKLWKVFYIDICIDALLGAVIHTIKINAAIKSFLWVVLLLTFILTINILLFIFKKRNINFLKEYLTLSLCIFFSILIFKLLKKDFLLLFTAYALIIIMIIFYLIIKNDFKNKIWYFIGFIMQILGGILRLLKVSTFYLDKNGIYHLFMVFTLILFFINNVNDIKNRGPKGVK